MGEHTFWAFCTVIGAVVVFLTGFLLLCGLISALVGFLAWFRERSERGWEIIRARLRKVHS